MMVLSVLRPDASLAEFLAYRARSASAARLAAEAVVGAAAIVAALWWNPSARLVIATATGCFSCYAIWGLLDRGMGKRDPRVDAYIAKSADFAKPIISHLRGVVHEACPEVEETMKWGVPHFDYKGVLCAVAAFKQHCNFILWKADLVIGPDANKEGGPLRVITKTTDLPSDKTLKRWIKEAAALNEQGVKAPKSAKPKKPLAVPRELTAALAKNKKAAARFDGFPRSHKREYAAWIAEAKGADTRQRRVETAVEWIAEGKSRNWKYEKR